MKPSRRTRRHGARDERGVALVLVLGAIAVMTVLLTEFQDENAAEVSSAFAERDALRAEYLARSAVNLSRLLIAAEPTMRQGLGIFFIGRSPPQVPIWEFADRILGAFNDGDGTAEFARLTGTDPSRGKNLGLSGGRFDVALLDEDSKLNVNLAARGDSISQIRLASELLALTAGDQYTPLFEQRDRDDQFTDRFTLCSSLIEWADPSELAFNCDPKSWATGGGAARSTKDAFYQLLKTPYRRKNAAYDSLEELHLVRGMGDDFWSTFVDPDPDNPKKRVVTVWGKTEAAVNVNTANAQTLWAVVCSYAKPQTPTCTDVAEIQKFLMAVTLVRGFTSGAPLFGNAADFIKTMKGQGMFGPLLSALGIKPIEFTAEAELAKLISTESKVFSIYADGVVPSYQRKTRVRIHAVVDFRGAPPPAFGGPGAYPSPTGSVASGALAPAPAASGAVGAFGAPGGASAVGPGGIGAAFAPNPGGTVIYFRIE